MTDFEPNSIEASIVKNGLPINPVVEVSALRLNNDFYSIKLQSGNKRGLAKIRCNLISDIKDGPKHGAHLDIELKTILRDAVNSMK